MLVALSSTPDNDRGPRYAEQALAAIHQADQQRRGFSLEYGRDAAAVGLYVRYAVELKTIVEGQLAAQYPHGRQKRIVEYLLEPPEGWQSWSASLQLRPELYSLRSHREFENANERTLSDPIAGILSAISPDNEDDLRCRIVIEVRPAGSLRRFWAERIVDRMNGPFFGRRPMLAKLYISAATSWWLPRMMSWPCTWLFRSAAGEATKGGIALASANEKLGRHLFDARLRLIVSGPPGVERKAKRKIMEIGGAFGQFTSPQLATFQMHKIRRGDRRSKARFLLSDHELATLWHLPTATVRAPKMERNDSREMEPPIRLPQPSESGVAVLGRTAFRTRQQTFGIRETDRRRHLAIIGKTGMGKSTLLQRLIVSDMRAGRGVGLIDPHGDLAEDILRCIPRNRTNDVILFDAGDREFPPAYNPLACKDPARRPLVAAAVLSAFKKLYGDSWGPRLEHILRNALLSLLDTPGTTLVSLMQILIDKNYRNRILDVVEDDLVRSFWRNEFEAWPAKMQAEAVSPIQNKVGQFLSSPLLRAIVSQSESLIDLRQAMDQGKILIVNLSKGRIGEDAASLLGSLLISDLQQQAMSRAELAEDERNDFFLYVDEFQNFATESFATILSEARKYRLSLTLANQYLAQMDDSTRDAVFGNVGSLLSFQVGLDDAEALAAQFAGDLSPQDLVGLPQYTAYLRLLINGMPSKPFSMNTLPPMREGTAQKEEVVRRRSRSRYARSA